MAAQARGRESPRGELPLVLLPGTLCDERVFDPLIERLPGIASHVLLSAGARSIGEAAEIVLAGTPSSFALLGFSLGGIVAMEVALRAPERVRGLALLQTTPLPVPIESHPIRRAAVEEAREMGLRHYVRQRLWPEYCGTTPGEHLQPLLEDMAERVGLQTFAGQVEMAVTRRDYRDRLRAVRCPALVLSGGADRVCRMEASEALEQALHGCVGVTLSGAGHLALLERSDEIAAAVAAWFHTVQKLHGSQQGSGCPDGAEEIV